MFSKFLQTIESVFPCRHEWFENVNDFRVPYLITYQLKTIFWSVLLGFTFKTGSNRSLFFYLKDEDFSEVTISNFKKLTGDKNIERIPHYDTTKGIMSNINPEEIERSGIKLTRHKIRRKTFDSLRFKNKYVLLALDGTQQLFFKKQHCPHCLKTKIRKKDKDGDETTDYYYHHNLLTARIVFPNGITLFAGMEFIENSDPEYNKQNCEIKAGYKLIEKVKKYFPQLNICILADGLYLNQKIIKKCEEYNWKYFITFKEGKASALHTDYEYSKKINPNNKKVEIIQYGKNFEKELARQYYWQNQLDFTSGKVNIIECIENKQNKKTRFLYATNFRAEVENINYLINEGGRQRSKIENEVFNEEKNSGYNLEHLYCEELNAIKNYTIVLSIAHMLNQIFEKGILSKKQIKQYGGVKYITKKLLDSFKYMTLVRINEKCYLSFDTS